MVKVNSSFSKRLRAAVFVREGDSGGPELLGLFPCFIDAQLCLERAFASVGRKVGGDSAVFDVVFQPTDLDGTFYMTYDALGNGGKGRYVKNNLVADRRAADLPTIERDGLDCRLERGGRSVDLIGIREKGEAA